MQCRPIARCVTVSRRLSNTFVFIFWFSFKPKKPVFFFFFLFDYCFKIFLFAVTSAESTNATIPLDVCATTTKRGRPSPDTPMLDSLRIHCCCSGNGNGHGGFPFRDLRPVSTHHLPPAARFAATFYPGSKKCLFPYGRLWRTRAVTSRQKAAAARIAITVDYQWPVVNTTKKKTINKQGQINRSVSSTAIATFGWSFGFHLWSFAYLPSLYPTPLFYPCANFFFFFFLIARA